MSFAEKPPILSGNDRQDIANLRDYLFRMARSLEPVANTGSQNLAVQYQNRKQIVVPTGGGGVESADIEQIRRNATELRDLILKTARETQQEIDNIEMRNFFVKYADDFAGDYPAVMYNAPTENTAYMGVCVSTDTIAPTNPALYEWSRVKGNTGPQGDPGEDGQDGTSVTVNSILYGTSGSSTTEPTNWSSTAPSSVMQGSWLWVRTYYSDGSTATTKSYIGTDGEDGVSLAVQSATKTGGVTTVVIADSEGHTTTLTIADGEDGDDGTPGTDGLNGYVHTAWANSADGQEDFSTSVSTGKKYLGVYTDNTLADSQDYRDYSWSLIKGDKGNQGDQGIPGPPGANGQTTYLHIKYSDDGETFTPNQGEDLGAYIGMYTDFIQADSMTFSDYEWHRFADDTELMQAIQAGDAAVTAYVDSLTQVYNSRYLYKSEFGTFQENITSMIETTAKGVVESYDYASAIQSTQNSVNLLQGYYTSIEGEIRRGIVLDPDTNEYVTGIAIAQNLKFSGECGPADPENPGDGYTYYYMNSGQTFGLYTSVGWQFWIDGYKKGWYNSQDGMLHVANILVEDQLNVGGTWKFSSNGTELEITYVGS